MRLKRPPRKIRSFDQRFYAKLLDEAQKSTSSGHHAQDALKTSASASLDRLQESALSYSESLVRGSRSILRVRRRHHRGFVRRLRKYWGPALDLLYTLIVCNQEAGGDFIGRSLTESARRLPEGNQEYMLHDALADLHARACRTALDVFHLLESGLAAGAMARCRTLHELAVISMVLREYSSHEGHEDLAERFLDHHYAQNRRDARTYQDNHAALGMSPLSDESLIAIESNYYQVINRYGKDYAEPYGWAAGLEGIRRPTFATLERLAGLPHLRGYYQWASHEVHADSKGNTLNTLERANMEYRRSGYTNIGLVDPGHTAAISLHQCLTALLNNRERTTPQDLFSMNAFGHLVERIGDLLLAGHDAVTQAEERFQAKQARSRVNKNPRPDQQ